MSGDRIETAGEHTPTTDEVRESYQMEMSDDGHDFPRREREFDRWLAQVTAEAEARGAREALLGAAEALDTAQVWWGDYRDSDGHQRYGACLHEVIDPDSRPYPTTRFVGLTDWLRARAHQTGVTR